MAEMAWTIACLFGLVIHGASAYQFTIGGKAGWVPPTGSDKEIFNHWAERNRFLIDDTLVFKYNPSVDSLLQVSAQDYNTCTTSNPIKSYNDGNTVFKFPSAGPFYFISGNATNCQMGEKLVTVVLSPRKRSASPASAPSAAPVMTPASSPVATSPAPTVASPSVAPSPAPTVASPSVVPTPAPTVASPSVVPAPAPTVASPSVVPSPAPTVATPPAPAPVSVPSISPGAAQLAPTPAAPYVSSPTSAVPAVEHGTSFAPAGSPSCLVSAAVAVVALALSLAV